MTPRVRSFETDEILAGGPSPELVRHCRAAEGGAAAAYQDEAGVWQYVPPAEQRRLMLEGRDVVPVRLDDGAS